MKKYIVTLVVLCAAAYSASAQADTVRTAAKDRLEAIENSTAEIIKKKTSEEKKFFEFEAVKHLAFGGIILNNEVFNPFKPFSNEFFLNCVELSINPAPWFSLTAGLDAKWARYKAVSEKNFAIVSDQISAIDTDETMHDMKSVFRTISLTTPVMLNLKFDKLLISLGAEAVFGINKNNMIISKYSDGKRDIVTKEKGGSLEKTMFDYIAAVSFDDMGIYAKYCPEELIPGNDMIKDYFTVGLILFL